MGGLEGVKMEGSSKETGRTYYDNPIVKDTCWVIDVRGKSEIGNFKARYYFHEKLGFVYFYYDFVSYQVEINLVNFKQLFGKLPIQLINGISLV